MKNFELYSRSTDSGSHIIETLVVLPRTFVFLKNLLFGTTFA